MKKKKNWFALAFETRNFWLEHGKITLFDTCASSLLASPTPQRWNTPPLPVFFFFFRGRVCLLGEKTSRWLVCLKHGRAPTLECALTEHFHGCSRAPPPQHGRRLKISWFFCVFGFCGASDSDCFDMGMSECAM
jgi:hypothetical protein